MLNCNLIRNTLPMLTPPNSSFQLDSGSSHTLMIDDKIPDIQQAHPLIEK